MRAARLERDIQGGPPGGVAALFRVAERLDFGVGSARASVPSAADNFSISDQDRAHHRVGGGGADSAPGQAQGELQELGFSHGRGN